MHRQIKWPAKMPWLAHSRAEFEDLDLPDCKAGVGPWTKSGLPPVFVNKFL